MRTPVLDPHRQVRPVVAVAVLAAGLGISQGMAAFVVEWAKVVWFLISGQADEFTSGLAVVLVIVLPIASFLLLLPFIAVAAAVMERGVSWMAVVIAFGVSATGTVILLQDDNWGWSKMLVTPLAVGAVLLVDFAWMSFRTRRRTAHR